MKSARVLGLALALAAGHLGTAVVLANGDGGNAMDTPAKDAPGQLVRAAGKADAAWLAKARADYPLTTCTVSGDELGGAMGPPLDFIYRQEGQPDRLVRFCCPHCIKDFNKDPAKYLKMIDEAGAAKARGAKPSPSSP